MSDTVTDIDRQRLARYNRDRDGAETQRDDAKSRLAAMGEELARFRLNMKQSDVLRLRRNSAGDYNRSLENPAPRSLLHPMPSWGPSC